MEWKFLAGTKTTCQWSERCWLVPEPPTNGVKCAYLYQNHLSMEWKVLAGTKKTTCQWSERCWFVPEPPVNGMKGACLHHLLVKWKFLVGTRTTNQWSGRPSVDTWNTCQWSESCLLAPEPSINGVKGACWHHNHLSKEWKVHAGTRITYQWSGRPSVDTGALSMEWKVLAGTRTTC